MRLDKLHTPSQLCNLIIHHVDNYYNNVLKHNFPQTITTLAIYNCITYQNMIDWGYLTSGRISSSFHPVLRKYFRLSKPGHRNIIKLLWNSITPLDQNTVTISIPHPKRTFYNLPQKYPSNLSKLKVIFFKKYKKIFFSYTDLSYLEWSTKELYRWLSSARKILQRYKLS